jgi:hypothetical protein
MHLYRNGSLGRRLASQRIRHQVIVSVVSMSMSSKKWRIAVNGVALVVVISCAPSSQDVSASSGPVNPTSSALSTLATIPVAKEKPARYKRSLFAEGQDADKDGCKTRQEVLIRDSVRFAQVAQPGCEVTAGDWRSAYDAKTWTDPGDVDVDHVVSLKEVWDSGGFAWSATKRADYANDITNPLTLQAVTKAVNRQKGDKDPSNWLPPLASYRCTYLENWVAIKSRWGLSMDKSEFGRTKKLLTECARSSTTTTQPKNSTTTTLLSTLPDAATGTSSSRELLASIPVQKENGVGYLRTLFPHWKDLDGDGCDTREEVLIRDSITKAQVDPFGCQVVAGDWVSPYDGGKWTDRGDIDIDHVVALKEAWDSGAWAWTTAQRTAFANDLTDPRTLLAVTDSVNQTKSDKDPSNWLPPLASYRCTYLDSWVAIKARWKLSMDQSEFTRISQLLNDCPQADAASPVASLPVASNPVASNPVASTPNAVTPVAASPAVTSPSSTELKIVSPGAWCTPEGARGTSKTGGSYLCAKTSATGEAYKDGRARWRQG